MKKTRRGGLGRGLGALIQSTADAEETTAPASSAAPTEETGQTVSSEDEKEATPRRRTTSAAAAASEKSADKTPGKTASSKKSNGTRSSSSSTKSSTTKSSSSKSSTTKPSRSKTPAASTASKEKVAASGTTSTSTSSATGAKKSASTDSSAVSGGKVSGTTTTAASRNTRTGAGAGGTTAAEKSADAPKSASGRGSRPVDVFFSSDRTPTEGDAKGGRATTAAEEGATTAVEEQEQTDAPSASSRSAAGRKSSVRRGRPSMPAVNALGRRAPAEPAEAEKVSEKSAAGSVPGTTDVTAGAEVSEAGTVPTDIAVLRELKVTDIHPNPRQPREVFDEDHMDELVTSITEVGILQPIVVREVSGPTPYELIMGERRWRATQLAGLDTIPAIVRHTPDEDLLRDALLENLHRSQLNPLEEAAAYQQLMDDFECTQEELSQRIGRSRPQISNTLRLMKLPPLVQRRVANNTLTAGHARALLGLTDPAEMERLAQRIVSEGLSVRATEEAVALAQGVRQAAPATRRRSEPTRHERLDYFATALTSRLDTQVKITLGKRKGKIAIDFASVEDLNRIMELIQGDDAEK